MYIWSEFHQFTIKNWFYLVSFSLLFAADLVGLALTRRIWSIGSLTVLTTTYFKFDGQVYRQKFGAAMGEPCLSYHSYLFMEDLGETVLSTAPPTIKPRLWKKVWGQCPCYCQRGLSRPTEDPSQPSWHNREHEVHKWVGRNQFYPFLGYKNCEEKVQTATSSYWFTGRSPTQANISIFSSHHLLHQKLGVYRTLMDRANGIITRSEDVQIEEDHIKSSLRNCGYPDWSFRQIDQQISQTSNTKPKPNQKKGMVTIPYFNFQGYFRSTPKNLQQVQCSHDYAPSLQTKKHVGTP